MTEISRRFSQPPSKTLAHLFLAGLVFFGMGCRSDKSSGDTRARSSNDPFTLPNRGDSGDEKTGEDESGDQSKGRRNAEGKSHASENPVDDFVFDSLPAGSKTKLPPNLRDFQQIFADVAEIAIPAVVSISSERNISTPEGDGAPYDDFLENGPFQYFFGQPQQ